MKCPKCQTENKSNCKFCVQCGTSLNRSNSPNNSQNKLQKVFAMAKGKMPGLATKQEEQNKEQKEQEFESIEQWKQEQLTDIIVKQASAIEEINKRILKLEQEVEKLKDLKD